MADCENIVDRNETCAEIDPSDLTLDTIMPIESEIINGTEPKTHYSNTRYRDLRRLINLIERGMNDEDKLLTKVVYSPNNVMTTYRNKDNEKVDRKTFKHIQNILVMSPIYGSQFTIHQIGSNKETTMSYSNGLPNPTEIRIHEVIKRYVTPNQINKGNTSMLINNFKKLLNRATCIYNAAYCKGYMRYLSDISMRNNRLILYRTMMLHKLLAVMLYFNNQLIALTNAKRKHYTEVYNNPNKSDNLPVYYINYDNKNVIPDEIRASNRNKSIKMISPEEATRLIPDENVSNHFVGIMQEGFANMNYNYENVEEAPIMFDNVDEAKLLEQQETNLSVISKNKKLKEELNEMRGKIEATRKLNRGTYHRLLASYLFIAIVVSVLLYVMLRV
jgi:hypothetical protein